MTTVTGPTTSVVGHIATWANSTGTSIADGGVTPIDWFNVVNYGADKTGAADSTTAIQNAISAAGGGGVVYFPAGTYKASSISVNSANLSLIGDGQFATTLTPSSTAGNFLTFSGNHGTIANLAIVINNMKRTSGDTIFVNAGAVSIENLQIIASGSGGFFNGIHFDTATAPQFSLTNFLIGNCSGAAVQIGDATNQSQVVSGNITNGSIGTCGNGIAIYDTGGINVFQVDIISCTSHGVVTFPSPGQTPFALFFTNVLCDTCGSDGWFIGTNGGSVGDVHLVGCWGASNSGAGINLAGATSQAVDGIVITGGDYTANQQQGIALSACTNVIVNGAQVYNNSQAGSGKACGIGVAANVSGFQILNCISGVGGHTQQVGYGAYQSYGILVASGSSNNYIIQSNRCPGNLSGGVIDAGTGTSKIVTNNLNS